MRLASGSRRRASPAMNIVALYTADESRGPMTGHEAVQLRAGCGIVGDRHYKRNTKPEEQLTLIEHEAVDAFNEEFGQEVQPHQLRRNIVTQGVDLNALEGHEFMVGPVRVRGIELCEPCSVVGKLLAGELTPTRIIQSFMGRGGLRCEILSTGVVRVGDDIVIPSE